MGRDYRKLRVFALADDLVVAVYADTKGFPLAERFGLQAQIRRAAVSTANCIVEGSARRSTGEYLNFFNVAVGSASEARYLVDLSFRLGLIEAGAHRRLTSGYDSLIAQMQSLIKALSPKPKA
jgi:four helix bundle protein